MCRQPAEIRLLALALLNYADDEGYFQAHPALIRGDLMPFEESTRKIPKMLEALEGIGYITLQQSPDGREIGHITNFLKHQRIDKPKKSKITRTVQDESKTNPRQLQDESKEEQGTGNREEDQGEDGSGKRTLSPPESLTGSEPEKKEGGAGVPVTVEEALAYAESYSKGNAEMLIIEDASVRNWFDDRCSCGWQPVRSGVQVPIPDWRADLRKWAREDNRRNGYATVSAPKKEKAVPVEDEPAGWWDAWALCWPDVPVPGSWHGIAESFKTELRIKLEDMSR